MAHHSHAYNDHRHHQQHHEDDDDDEEDDDSYESSPTDRIRRHYHPQVSSQQQQSAAGAASGIPLPQPGGGGAGAGAGAGAADTLIHVQLNESYFARERQLLVNTMANVRQTVSSLRMFNPAKNESIKQQAQQEWNEKEKYTLDSLNELRNGHQQQRTLVDDSERPPDHWTHPLDGREVWPSKLQYFLAITSYSIGLGNVIRFPILVQKNGGLAFIIPFVIMLLLEGIPLFYLELAIGQRMRKASISCWNLVSPFAAGIGLASACVSFIIGLYYNTMVAWTLIYAWSALTNQLPQVLAHTVVEKCEGGVGVTSQVYERDTNETNTPNECQLTGTYEFYWYRETLNVSDNVSDWSHFNWPVAICLCLAWLISYLCLSRGLSSSKRLVYTISIFPYVILVVFFAKAIQLDGMEHGLRYLFAPDWPKLLDPFVWLQAAAQVFFSLGLGFGGLIALSSYNSINNNCYRDAVKVSLINFATSILAGVVIFSILGFRAQLNYSKCQVERDQQIDFYLADYNLKVLDYGAVFKQVHKSSPPGKENEDKRQQQRRIVRSLEETRDKLAETTTTISPRPPSKSKKKASKKKKEKQKTQEELPTSTRRPEVTQFVAVEQEKVDKFDSQSEKEIASNSISEDEFSAADAIDSITNLDRQLDLGSPSGSFDYGDADTEFILNASSLITSQQLEEIISGIKGLPECSIESELEQSTRGTGLVFVVIAEAIGQFDSIQSGEQQQQQESLTTHKVNPLHLSASTWAILFFLMILALGFDSQFGNLEGLLSSLTDLNYFNFNNKNNANHLSNGHEGTHDDGQQISSPVNGQQQQQQAHSGNHSVQVSERIIEIRRWATGVICLLSLAISLVFFAHGAGAYMFAIFDEYASNFSLILIALFELLAISYIYPLGRFANDCELMTGKRPPFIVLLSWRFISPVLLLIILLATLKQFTSQLDYEIWSVLAVNTTTTSELPQHLHQTPWPNWAIMLGVILILCCVIWIPLVPVLKIARITLIPEEESRQWNGQWFPTEELKEFHQLADGHEHQVTRLERILFGFTADDD